MKKGFTLIEMLVVVAVMATLMTVVFRLSSVSDSEERRTRTIVRMQKLENCLSGYYAAFGSYPPVKIHGSRDIYLRVDNGIQTESEISSLNWRSIDAACLSQPIAARFPFSDDQAVSDSIEALSAEIADRITSGRFPKWAQDKRASMYTSGFKNLKEGYVSGDWDETDWREVQIFQFGLMSFLLPRYLLMMGGSERYYGASGRACAQWTDNNDPICDACEGDELSWRDVRRYSQPGVDVSTRNNSDYSRIANVPTQIVCARWLPNLEKCCACPSSKKVFGVELRDSDHDMFYLPDDDSSPLPDFKIQSPGGQGGTYYLLDSISVYDGWERDFYYYSPDGYQTYTLWSAGPDGYTFPPWVDRKNINQMVVEETGGKTVAEIVTDDITRMSH